MPPGCYAFLLVLYTIKSLVFPLKTRKPLWRAIFSVITAPITAPTLFHTYIADVFTSMVKVFQDILWTGCFVVSGDFMLSETDPGMLQTQIWAQSMWYRNIVIPLICLVPLWIRFNQCLRRYMDTRKRMPNLANAFKVRNCEQNLPNSGELNELRFGLLFSSSAFCLSKIVRTCTISDIIRSISPSVPHAQAPSKH